MWDNRIFSKINDSMMEAIDASEAYSDQDSINTLLQGRRPIGTVNFSAVENGEFIKRYLKDNGFDMIPFGMSEQYIVYAPGHREHAIELYNEFQTHPSERDHRRIGELLSYTKDSIDRFISENGILESTQGLTDKQKETYKKWNSLVNMSKSELQSFYDSENGKKAGLSKKEAKGTIRRGRDSAKAILRMMDKSPSEWTANDWDWAKRQISFISRMKGGAGPLYDDKGEPTRKLLSLKIWGHNPKK